MRRRRRAAPRKRCPHCGDFRRQYVRAGKVVREATCGAWRCRSYRHEERRRIDEKIREAARRKRPMSGAIYDTESGRLLQLSELGKVVIDFPPIHLPPLRIDW